LRWLDGRQQSNHPSHRRWHRLRWRLSDHLNYSDPHR
jgi:hypothetical protein